MWFTVSGEDGGYIKVHLFREDIDEIRTGFNPDEWDGYPTVIIKKNQEELWIMEEEDDINKILAAERSKEIMYLHQ